MAANLWDKDMTLGTHITNLVQYVDSLPNDPSTLRVIVLSLYSTWQNRSLYWDTNSHIPTRKKPCSKHDDFGSNHEENLTDNQLQILKNAQSKAKCPISYYNILKFNIDLQTIEHNHFN